MGMPHIQRIILKQGLSGETSPMAKSPSEKKPVPEVRVLPMDLKLGDLLTDERSEWRVIGRPYGVHPVSTAHRGDVRCSRRPHGQRATEVRRPASLQRRLQAVPAND